MKHNKKEDDSKLVDTSGRWWMVLMFILIWITIMFGDPLWSFVGTIAMAFYGVVILFIMFQQDKEIRRLGK